MNKYIVTTTINKPTEATLRFCRIADSKDWTFVVVGDTKTPHDAYRELEHKHKNVVYLSPQQQDELYPELSEVLGWKTIQRRNIGFVYAYHKGADVVATVDDDNIPYDSWGDTLLVGQEVEVDLYKNTSTDYFDPISVTTHNELWHRGYPIEYLTVKNNIEYKGKDRRKVLVQADFWDGDPDIDALCRLSRRPIVKFEPFNTFGSTQVAPFNSQNTFLAREVLPYYAVLPFTGRMDDIWGGYILQHHFPNAVVYNKATVYQERNVQDLVTNLENEVIGYRNTLNLLQNLSQYEQLLPKETVTFWEVYRKQYA